MKKFTLVGLCLASAVGIASAGPKPGKPGKPEGGKHGPPPNPEEVIKHLDTDKNGTVSLAEFKEGPRAKKHPEKAEEHFKKIDADGNGEITLEELKKAPKPPRPPGGPEGGPPQDEAK